MQAVHERGMGKSEAARTFGVSLSSVKRYVKAVQEGRSLVPEKAPGKRAKLSGSERRLLEADVEERPWAKHLDRCEYLSKVAGVNVSQSTISREIRRMGFSRKKKDSGCDRTRRVLESRLEDDDLCHQP